jgi:putative membrane protein
MAERFQVDVDAANHFAWMRTRMGLERTLMAWTRTAASLIGFGFTIVQFFEHLSTAAGVAPARRPEMPRYLGLGLIAVGIGALAVAAWQYRWMVRYLKSPDFVALATMENAPRQTPILVVVIALLLIGIFAFASVAFRMF